MENKKQSISFQKLTPTDNAETGIYTDAIDFAFENADVNNIAISGPLGSGKSSVLLTYQKKHPEKKFINISLATFQQMNNSITSSKDRNDQNIIYDPKCVCHQTYAKNKDDEKEPSVEAVLEGKIINHLIHLIPSKNIPQTLFSTKDDVGLKKILPSAIVIATFILCILHIFFRTKWCEFVTKELVNNRFYDLFELTTASEAFIITGCLAAILAFAVLCKLIKVQKTKHVLKRLNVKGNEIELFENKEDSYFDKHLNEILYLLRHSGANAIVFEDLDRFDNNHIFVKLREINTLLNSKGTSDGKFMSALRKTQKCIGLATQRITRGKFEYKEKTRKTKEIKFFYLLRDDVFNPKDRAKFFDIIIPVISIVSVSNSINKFLEIFKNNGFENMIDKKFLRKISLYIDDLRILKNICNEFFVYYRTLNGLNLVCEKMLAIITYKNLCPKDFTDLLSNKGWVYTLVSSENSLSKMDDGEFEKHLNKEELINNYQYIYEDSYFLLLCLLIREGYIDSTYHDYISYFYDNDISRNDKLFLRSISDRTTLPSDFPIDNPNTIIESIALADFDRKEILNVNLFSYLLSNDFEENSIENVCLKRFIANLVQKKNFEFINLCRESLLDNTQLTKLVRYWPSFFHDIQRANNIDEEFIYKFSYKLLLLLDDDTLLEMNLDNCLTRYLSQNYNSVKDKPAFINRIISAFKLLDVKIEKIEAAKSDILYIDKINYNSLYSINFHNISLMLSRNNISFTQKDIKHRCYSLINAEPDSELCKYISLNMVTFLEMVLNSCENRIYDDESAVISVLNNLNIPADLKTEYVSCLETKLYDISQIKEKSLWKLVYNSKMLKSTEENIINYFKYTQELDELLISFINEYNEASEIDFSKYIHANPSTYDLKTREIMFEKVIVCNTLDNKRYIQILSTLGVDNDNFKYKGISIEKINLLIDNDIIFMDPRTINCIREEYSSALSRFIEHNFAVYFKMMRKRKIPHSEIVSVLAMPIDDEQKIALLDNVDEPISIKGKSLSETIRHHILENNLDDSDMSSLFINYDMESTEIQEIIFDYSKKHIVDSKTALGKASFSLQIKLFSDSTITIEQKVDLFIEAVSRLEREQASECLNAIGLEEHAKIPISRSAPKFEVTTMNKRILDAFKLRGWISDFRIETKNDKQYYKISRKFK